MLVVVAVVVGWVEVVVVVAVGLVEAVVEGSLERSNSVALQADLETGLATMPAPI